eukprot:GHVL01038587.1.p1 GENE.GHVL01038587.1~~GHVL01038587.1.p1  ORF type:complete len:418 (-),score=149.21 GHVL01038587.1:74-1327(-)
MLFFLADEIIAAHFVQIRHKDVPTDNIIIVSKTQIFTFSLFYKKILICRNITNFCNEENNNFFLSCLRGETGLVICDIKSNIFILDVKKLLPKNIVKNTLVKSIKDRFFDENYEKYKIKKYEKNISYLSLLTPTLLCIGFIDGFCECSIMELSTYTYIYTYIYNNNNYGYVKTVGYNSIKKYIYIGYEKYTICIYSLIKGELLNILYYNNPIIQIYHISNYILGLTNKDIYIWDNELRVKKDISEFIGAGHEILSAVICSLQPSPSSPPGVKIIIGLRRCSLMEIDVLLDLPNNLTVNIKSVWVGYLGEAIHDWDETSKNGLTNLTLDTVTDTIIGYTMNGETIWLAKDLWKNFEKKIKKEELLSCPKEAPMISLFYKNNEIYKENIEKKKNNKNLPLFRLTNDQPRYIVDEENDIQ